MLVSCFTHHHIPRPPSWIQRALLLKEGGYREGKGEREGKAVEWEEGKGKEREGREGTPVCIFKCSLE